MESLRKTWRWFGPDDPIRLPDIRQMGVEGIVTALHHIPNGQAWPLDEITKWKKEIEQAGMRWNVVESVPVTEDIKQQRGEVNRHLNNYRQTIKNLADCGITNICYNFMPVLDWTRTDLNMAMESGATALSFSMVKTAVFERHILKRANDELHYPAEVLAETEAVYKSMEESEIRDLIDTVIAGLPGAEEHYTVDSFRQKLDDYRDIDVETLRTNLVHFLKEVIPAAEEYGVTLALHPDDPPYPLFGLPRVVGSMEDLEYIFKEIPSPNNGLTFCSGSLGVREENNLAEIARKFSERIHFIHLRNIIREDDGSFTEADHLEGDLDMVEVLKRLLEIQNGRGVRLPMRPDHGFRMMDDVERDVRPGYSKLGRFQGLSKLQGVEHALLQEFEISF